LPLFAFSTSEPAGAGASEVVSVALLVAAAVVVELAVAVLDGSALVQAAAPDVLPELVGASEQAVAVNATATAMSSALSLDALMGDAFPSFEVPPAPARRC